MKNKDLIYMLNNPEVFEVNREKPTSDYIITDKNKMASTYRHNLNGRWLFNYLDDVNKRDEDAHLLKDFSNFDTIEVPSHIEFNGYGNFQYVNTQYPWDGKANITQPNTPQINPVGQYVKKFDLPSSFIGRPIYLTFEGAEVAINVWVNSSYVGYSEDSHTTSTFDISKFTNEKDNILYVEVYKYSSASWLEDQDHWRYFGLHRDVYISTHDDVHIRDLFVKTYLFDDYTRAKIKVSYDITKSTVGSVTLLDAYNDVVYKEDVCFDGSDFQVEVEKPKLWSGEDPYLYQLIIEYGNEIIVQKVGIREFKIINNVMCINGKRIFFRGINRHDVSCHSGRVVSKEQMLFDIKYFKQNNINALRTSHYPNQKYIYDLCDEYGLYVIDEVNLETHGTWQVMGVVQRKSSDIIPHHKKQWEGAVLDRANNMFQRDKNHPSIIIWSCGNESYAGKVLNKMGHFFRQNDDTRIVHYEGSWWYPKYNQVTDIYSGMYNDLNQIREFLENNPQKPMINCEYSHAMGNSNGNLMDYELLDDELPMFQGGFIWEYMDHGILVYENGKMITKYGGDFNDRPTDYNFVIDGIIKHDRTTTPKIQEVKHVFSPVKILVEKNKITFNNKLLFTNLKEFKIMTQVFLNGILQDEFMGCYEVPPLEKRSFDFNYSYNAIGEYVVRVSVLRKKGTSYAPVNSEVTFGEFSMKKGNVNYNLPHVQSQDLELIDGDVNIGIHGKRFSVHISKSKGKICSIVYNGAEYLPHPDFLPSPNFYRALTDNDLGANKGFELAYLKSASYSQYQHAKIENVEILDNCVQVKSCIKLATDPVNFVNVKYLIYKNGKIEITQSMEPSFKNADMFRYGMNFKIPHTYYKIKWYGNGPMETYIDRKSGAKLGIFETNIDDQIGYTKPQSYANITELRYIDILNQSNKGIRITSQLPFEASVTRYSDFELELASHDYELGKIQYTNVNVDMMQSGVGSDDSWGRWTLDKNILKAEGELTFTYCIEPVL